MGWNNIRRTRADILFSNWIRRKGKCEYCGKVCKVGDTWIKQLDCSHYIGRAKRTVRFDVENCHALCNPCHKRMGGYKRDENGEYDLWIQKLLGAKKYRLLVIRGNLPGSKTDERMELLFVKELIKLNENNT